MNLPGSEHSVWLTTKESAVYPTLTDTQECDVVIVGGGIAGLHCAYLLKKSGLKVIVLEKHVIGSGTTGGTTAKVTYQHGLIYDQLIRKFGHNKAQLYADVSVHAYDEMRRIIADENIICNWTEKDNYVYSTESLRRTTLQREVQAAVTLGLPARFETESELPFKIIGSVMFAYQAQFHPIKYVKGLAKVVQGQGTKIFENSTVNSIREGTECKVRTHEGTVIAKHIIIATKIPPGPLAARLTYASIEYPTTSYLIACPIVNPLLGMYISPDSDHYSLSTIIEAGKTLLLVGGEGHIPGMGSPTARHRKLARYAEEHFGITNVAYRWKAMDYMAYDSLPIAGKLYPWSKKTFVLSGFKKWGMNLSFVTAKHVTEMILGQKPVTEKLFDPCRASAPLSIPKKLVT